MKVKKAFGKVYGAQMSAAEKKAMDKEIRRQLADYDMKNAVEIDAMVLWILHDKFGFGIKRLKRFFDCFSDEMSELAKRYELDESESSWLCTYKLEQLGVDLNAWEKERCNNNCGE